MGGGWCYEERWGETGMKMDDDVGEVSLTHGGHKEHRWKPKTKWDAHVLDYGTRDHCWGLLVRPAAIHLFTR